MRIMQLLMLAVLATGLTACGTKGKLKTPTQTKLEEAKKAKKAADKKAETPADAETPDDDVPAEQK